MGCQVLEALYMGDIHTSKHSFKEGDQYAKALNDVVKAGMLSIRELRS